MLALSLVEPRLAQRLDKAQKRLKTRALVSEITKAG